MFFVQGIYHSDAEIAKYRPDCDIHRCIKLKAAFCDHHEIIVKFSITNYL
jgi:hypothetical protein